MSAPTDVVAGAGATGPVKVGAGDAGPGAAGATSEVEERLLPSGDEAGTSPGDRPFRPDVEGLRALAVGLVVLYHAGVPRMSGGYVSVDFFFVISGFVITGVLLRERQVKGRNSLLNFYARRARRILPAATLVAVATVSASYRWLGFLRGDSVVSDARAAVLYFANFRFIAQGTNYINSQQPPSPLQHFWSLSVEEQFYLVFPSFLILVALVGRRYDLRVRLAVALTAVIGASLAWSVVQTSSNGVAAYFSPFTRAWEFALGALVAVAFPVLVRLPRPVGVAASWLGLAGLFAGVFLYDSTTAFPGYAVALPVVSTALVIAAGTVSRGGGSEILLGRAPMRWLGERSYSLYLIHWPLLIVVAQHAGHALSVWDNLGLMAIAVVAAAVLHAAVENPIRHSRWLASRRWASVGTAVLISGAALVAIAIERHAHP